RALAFERFDQPRLLAADVSARAAMHVDFAVKARAKDVLPEEALRPRLRECLLENLRALRKLTADVDVSEVRIDREARDHHALDELMRVLMDDVAILERPRLRLVRVADEICRLRPPALDEAPLRPARKPRAPTPTQPGLLHLLHDRLRLH